MGSKTKQFKDYDKSFSRREIEDCRKKWLYDRVKNTAVITGIRSWPNWGTMRVHQWPQADVQYAVYQGFNFLDWQLFRVSMKGLTTQEKIFMCMQRLEDNIALQIEHVRVHNYLGALVRGGQLDADYNLNTVKGRTIANVE